MIDRAEVLRTIDKLDPEARAYVRQWLADRDREITRAEAEIRMCRLETPRH